MDDNSSTFNPLGDNLLPSIVLAIGGALFVGTLLAMFRPRQDPEGNDLERPPLARSIVMLVIGGVAAAWGLASILA